MLPRSPSSCTGGRHGGTTPHCSKGTGHSRNAWLRAGRIADVEPLIATDHADDQQHSTQRACRQETTIRWWSGRDGFQDRWAGRAHTGRKGSTTRRHPVLTGTREVLMNLDPKIDDVRGRLLETKVVGTSRSVIKNNVQVVRRSTACFAAKSTRALDSADKLSWVLLEEVPPR
jgi:hypothetical protein